MTLFPKYVPILERCHALPKLLTKAETGVAGNAQGLPNTSTFVLSELSISHRKMKMVRLDQPISTA